jgi:hypothetical protein
MEEASHVADCRHAGGQLHRGILYGHEWRIRMQFRTLRNRHQAEVAMGIYESSH